MCVFGPKIEPVEAVEAENWAKSPQNGAHNARDLNPYKVSYMVLQVTARPDRQEDWFMIPELSKAYNELQEYVRQQRYDHVEQSLAAFKAITYTCNDLIETDQDTLVDKVETR